jgi:hypothetical protein
LEYDALKKQMLESDEDSNSQSDLDRNRMFNNVAMQ